MEMGYFVMDKGAMMRSKKSRWHLQIFTPSKVWLNHTCIEEIHI